MSRNAVLFVVITLMSVSSCVKVNVTLKVIPDAKTVHPLVLEALVSPNGVICADDCIGKGLKIQPYVEKCNEIASAEECHTALYSGRSEQQIRDHVKDGPVYLDYLQKYLSKVVVAPDDDLDNNSDDDDSHLDDSKMKNNTGKKEPHEENPHSEENKLQPSSVSWKQWVFTVLVIIVVGQYKFIDQHTLHRADIDNQIFERMKFELDAEKKLAEVKEKLDEEQKKNSRLEECLKHNVKIVKPRSCEDRLNELSEDQLRKLCEDLKLSKKNMEMVFKKRKLHTTRVKYIMQKCDVTEDDIKRVLDAYEKETATPEPLIASVDLRFRDFDGGFGGVGGLGGFGRPPTSHVSNVLRSGGVFGGGEGFGGVGRRFGDSGGYGGGFVGGGRRFGDSPHSSHQQPPHSSHQQPPHSSHQQPPYATQMAAAGEAPAAPAGEAPAAPGDGEREMAPAAPADESHLVPLGSPQKRKLDDEQCAHVKKTCHDFNTVGSVD